MEANKEFPSQQTNSNPFDYNYNTNYHQQAEVDATDETQQDSQNSAIMSGNHSPTSPSKFFATFSTQSTNYVPPTLSPNNANEINNITLDPATETNQETLEFDDAYTWQVCFSISLHLLYKFEYFITDETNSS